jgi:hypothetical protein
MILRIWEFFRAMQLSICHEPGDVLCGRSGGITKTENYADGFSKISGAVNGK